MAAGPKRPSKRKLKTLPGGEAANVLLVEDSSDIRQVLKAMIAPLGANIHEAKTGREGLEVLKSKPIDVVISDLIMPEMSGMMLLHSMLEIGLHVPFILISGHADKDAAIQALRLGAFDFLEKPMHQDDLREVISEAISVSLEQRNLIRDLRRKGSLIDGAESGDSRAELYIMKLRTLRYHQQQSAPNGEQNSANAVDDSPSPKSWSDLRSIFVQEAEAQLAFCQASLESIGRGEDSDREQMFLARVIQSVRLASEAIRLNHVAEFAWAIEVAVATLRVRKHELAMSIPLLRDAICKLRAMVMALDDQEAQGFKRQLEALLNDQPKARAGKSA